MQIFSNFLTQQVSSMDSVVQRSLYRQSTNKIKLILSKAFHVSTNYVVVYIQKMFSQSVYCIIIFYMKFNYTIVMALVFIQCAITLYKMFISFEILLPLLTYIALFVTFSDIEAFI